MSSGFLLDTNVLSESRRRTPDAHALAFVAGLPSERVYISVLTIGELWKGVGARRRTDAHGAALLADWITEIVRSYGERLLPVDMAVARIWGGLSADRPRPAVDTLIAATALARDLTLVTRNVRDIADTGVRIANPWDRP